MIEKEDYNDYCYMSDQTSTGRQVSFDEHYKGQYALAQARNGKFAEGLETAKNYVAEKGYTKFNPFSVIIAELGNTLSKEQLDEIKTQILTYLGGEKDAVIQADVDAIEQLLA